MSRSCTQFIEIIEAIPAVDSVVGFTGGGADQFRLCVRRAEAARRAQASVDQVIGRLRGKLGQVPGARLFLQAVQDIRVGGRQSNAQYQYTLQGDDLAELYELGAEDRRGAGESCRN